MLNEDDNRLICRVGPDTPMGTLMRQYWFPAIPSRDLPASDGRPLKVRLLGEDLIAFRDSRGRVGLLEEHCPHRGASLYFGRNEECGLRCVYHGWKFDITGRCVELPSEPEESRFAERVRARAYPCRELNGMIWTYMGPREDPPCFPRFEITTLPAEHALPPHVMLGECNWLQGLESDMDSAHLDWVHGKPADDSPDPSVGLPGIRHRDRRPRLEVIPTPYGGCYSASRRWDDAGTTRAHRINQFIMPFFTIIAAPVPNLVHLRAWVPIDDEHHVLYSLHGWLDRPVLAQERRLAEADPFAGHGGYVERTSDPLTRYYTTANLHNDYLFDAELARTSLNLGVPFLYNLQDRVMTESMGPIANRSREHLGATDAMVIFVRRTLLRAAKALDEQGVLPPTVTDPNLCRVRSASILLPRDESWIEATEALRRADSGEPIVAVSHA